MANHWFRTYSEFSTDAKVQSMSEAMQRRLIMLFCLRSCDVLVTLQEQDIAFQLRITESELLETKALFVKKCFIDNEWNVLNWEKRQFTSDNSSKRTAEYRARKKLEKELIETSQKRHGDALDTDTDTDTENKKIVERSRGSRLTQSWTAPDDYFLFCKTERPDLDPEAMQNKFRDYWSAVPGKDGKKLDWLATWRNFVRGEKASRQSNNGKPYESAKDKLRRETMDALTGRKRDKNGDIIRGNEVDITPRAGSDLLG